MNSWETLLIITYADVNSLLILVSGLLGILLLLLSVWLMLKTRQFLTGFKKNEERLNRILQGCKDGYWEWNVNTDRIFWSDRLYAILGLPVADEPIDFQFFKNLIASSEKDAVLAAINKSLYDRTPFEQSFKMVHASGRLIDCFSTGKPYYDEQGEIIHMAGMLSDATEEKQMREALEESEARFRQLAQSNLIGIAFWNIYGKIYDANDAFLTLMGYSRQEMKAGKLNWRDLTLREDQLAHGEAVQKAISGQAIVPYETQYIHRDGHKIEVLVGFAMLEGSRDQGFAFVLDISDRKAVEVALRESAQRFRYMAESMPQQVWTALPDGKVDYMNRNWMTYSGKEWEALKDYGWLVIVHQQDKQNTTQRWKEALRTGGVAELEHRLRRQDGLYRWHLSRGIPMKDDTGKIVMWIGTSTDVHDFKQAQLELQESEERFRMLADQAPIIIWLTSPQGDMLYSNKYWREFSGMANAQGQDWSLCVAPQEKDFVLNTFQDSIAKRSHYELQYRMKRFDGEYRWIQATGVPRYSSEGVFSGYVCTCLDITDQRRAKEELEELVRQRTVALEKSSNLLHLIVENVPVMIFVKNAADLRFELFNTAGHEITGYSDEEFIGKNDYDFFPKEQADFFIQKDRETLNNKVLVNVPEEPILTKEGAVRILHTRKVPILDEQGNPAYLLGVSEDITEYKQTQAQIQLLNEQLQEQIQSLNTVNKELEAFSYSVSHDLRAPLRTIDGFSQAILEDYSDKLDDEGKRYLKRVREGSQQMAQLIDDMLNLSRLTRGEIRKEAADLSKMAHEIAEDLLRYESERKVTFVIQDDLVAYADSQLMRSVMENLLGNSWKFTSHHPTARIEFGMTDKAIYFVKDNGAGFDMAYVDKLFGVFQRLHDMSEFEGNGIGLASAQRIIHRHGGDIWADSAVEKGATFYFTL